MNILNYFFIGVAFIFVLDILLNIDSVKTHPKLKGKNFGWGERIMCVIVWPLAVIVFLIAFIKQFFKN
jgi:hypothetical protein